MVNPHAQLIPSTNPARHAFGAFAVSAAGFVHDPLVAIRVRRRASAASSCHPSSQADVAGTQEISPSRLSSFSYRMQTRLPLDTQSRTGVNSALPTAATSNARKTATRSRTIFGRRMGVRGSVLYTPPRKLPTVTLYIRLRILVSRIASHNGRRWCPG